MQIEQVDIETLVLDPANVRQHSERNLDAIKSSLTRFGQQKPIVINGKGVVIAGNGTLTAAKSLGWDSIQAIQTELEGSEATAFAIADNRTAELAEWDIDSLIQQVNALEREDPTLAFDTGFSKEELDKLVEETKAEPNYTRKVEAPIYEPSDEKPKLQDLLDDSKTKQLVKDIKEANLSEEIESFLLEAASRHTKFNFGKIADFYAHTDDPKLRKLFQESALVVIDFDQAIELGFVRLTEAIKKAVGKQDDAK